MVILDDNDDDDDDDDDDGGDVSLCTRDQWSSVWLLGSSRLSQGNISKYWKSFHHNIPRITTANKVFSYFLLLFPEIPTQ